MSRPFLRWAVPAGLAAVVLGLVGGVTAMRASAQPNLPPRDAAQLLVDLQTARLESFSGTVVVKADLGLPPLVGMAASAAGGGGQPLLGLINGSHTVRVWYAGPEKVRLALLDTLGETDIIRNGPDLWVWSSREQEALHRKVPTGTELPTSMSELIPGKTPLEVANTVLAAIDPSTVVSTAGTSEVAGRAAYELILAPRDKASLVSQIRVAIDAEKRLPLRVRVLAKGSVEPAFEVGFQQVSVVRPGDEHFQFNPPPGTKVHEQDPAREHKPGATKPGATKPGATKPGASKPGGEVARKATVVGEAWTSVVVVRGDALAELFGVDAGAPAKAQAGTGTGSAGTGSADIVAGMLATLPRVSGSWGAGHLFTSKLVSGLVTDDGRVLIGAVTPERLYTVAADPAAALK